jgi:hypothetical protein
VGNGFSRTVRHVKTGSPVSASNTSASTRDLESRTEYINNLLQTLVVGRSFQEADQPVAEDVLDGHAVYWNATNGRYERALAGVESAGADGSLVPSASADCLGIVVSKRSAALGTVAFIGTVQLTPEQLTNLFGDTQLPGRHYLSPVEAGRLVKIRPAITVAVAYLFGAVSCETGARVFLLPAMRDFLEDHVHYQFDLTPRPAGEHLPPTPGDPHVITAPDDALPGWLPADHAIFGGNAPAGAVFGYNLAADPALAAAWPPIPVAAVLLEIARPGSGFPTAGRVLSSHVLFDTNGIWWLTDCYGEVPWPTDYSTASLSSSSASDRSSSSSEACPSPGMMLKLSFTKMTFLTDRSVVTSLAPTGTSPIKVVDCNGLPARTGELFLDLDLEAVLQDISEPGSLVLKGIRNSRLEFYAGHVTEGLVTASPRLVLNGTVQRKLTSTTRLHQGIVHMDLVDDTIQREINPVLYKLGDTLERTLGNVEYLAFPENRDSALRMQFNVSYAGLPTTPQMRLRFFFFGRADGPWCELELGYRRLTAPSAGTPTDVDAALTTLALDVVTPSDDYDGAGTDLPADKMIVVDSDPFTVAAGDTVIAMLTRASDAVPVFDSEIGVVRVIGMITGA